MCINDIVYVYVSLFIYSTCLLAFKNNSSSKCSTGALEGSSVLNLTKFFFIIGYLCNFAKSCAESAKQRSNS